MSFGTESSGTSSPDPYAGMSALYGPQGQSTGGGMSEAVPTGYNAPEGPGIFDQIMKGLGDPDTMKLMSEMSAHTSRMSKTYSRATPEQQMMLDKQISDHMNKYVRAQQTDQPTRTPYTGDIPPEVAQRLLQVLGIPTVSSGRPEIGYGRGF